MCCNTGNQSVEQYSIPRRKQHPVIQTHLKLCDSSVADLSSRSRVFTSIESFHFVVQLPDKVDLQRAGAWGGVHRESCTVRSATTKSEGGGRSVIVQQRIGCCRVRSRDKQEPSQVLPFCRALVNDRVTFSSSF